MCRSITIFKFIILPRNIDCKSILQRTLKQFGVASNKERKARYRSSIQCVLLRRQVCQSAFRFGFLPSKPCLFLWNLAWNLFYIVKNPNLLVCRLNSPTDRSKYINISLRKQPFVLAARRWWRFAKPPQRRGAKRNGYFCRLEEYHFLAIPPHSQLIHNHEAEVYVPIASCPLWYIFGASSGRIGSRRKIVSQFLPMVLRGVRFARARSLLLFKVSLNTIKVILVDFVNLRKVPKKKKERKNYHLKILSMSFFFWLCKQRHKGSFSLSTES